MLSFPGFLVQVQSFFKSKFIVNLMVRLSSAAGAPSWLRKMANGSNMNSSQATLGDTVLNQDLICGLQPHAFDSMAEPHKLF